jgi:hypothetical protein
MSTNIPRGNVLGMWVAAVTFDPANIAAAGSSEQDITVLGAKVGDLAFVSKPTATAAMGVCSARVKSADTVAVTFIATAAANGGSEVYNVLVIRPDGTPNSVLPV